MDMVAKLSSRQKTIAGLTVATAVIHIILAILSRDQPMFLILFLLNGLGYLALIAGLYFMPQLVGQRGMVRWGLLGFTLVTFVLYFIFNRDNPFQPLGIVDKLIELALIIMLWQDK